MKYDPSGNSKYGIMEILHDSMNESISPRFAVAMDYYNIMEKEGVFTKFENKADEPHTFYLNINRKIFPEKMDLSTVNITSLDLYYYHADTNGFNKITPMHMRTNGNLYFACVFEKATFKNEFGIMESQEDKLVFLSVKFNPIHQVGFDQYDYSSPWIFRVCVSRKLNYPDVKSAPSHFNYQNMDELITKDIEITTHNDAEIPDFGLYSDLFPDDYSD